MSAKKKLDCISCELRNCTQTVDGTGAFRCELMGWMVGDDDDCYLDIKLNDAYQTVVDCEKKITRRNKMIAKRKEEKDK